MFTKQAGEMSRSNPKSFRQRIDRTVDEKSLVDETKSTRYRRGCSEPGWRSGRRFRSATEAGAEPGGLRFGRAAKKSTVFKLGRPSGADGPTVDSGGQHSSEEGSIEATVAALDRFEAGVRIESFCQFQPPWTTTGLRQDSSIRVVEVFRLRSRLEEDDSVSGLCG